jgi:hypothetical protein
MTTTETTIGINGMAHVMLTVSQFAAARAFYGTLLPALGMTPVCDTDKLFYCVGARTAIGIQPAGSEHNGDRFAQSRVGLHHLCLRARSREDVDRLHDLPSPSCRRPRNSSKSASPLSSQAMASPSIRQERTARMRRRALRSSRAGRRPDAPPSPYPR